MAALDTRKVLAGLDAFQRLALDGAGAGLDRACGAVTDTMRATQAHGNQTLATRTSYNARRVGRGETGAAIHAASVAAVEELNPQHVGTAPVTVDTALGVIIDSATDYQSKLETEHAGQKAVLGPTLQASASALTAAAAAGSKAAL